MSWTEDIQYEPFTRVRRTLPKLQVITVHTGDPSRMELWTEAYNSKRWAVEGDVMVVNPTQENHARGMCPARYVFHAGEWTRDMEYTPDRCRTCDRKER